MEQKEISLRTLEHMEPDQAKKCLEKKYFWIIDGAYCDPNTGMG